MNDSTPRPRGRRTFTAFGEVRRMPSEYEIVTHAQNWTTRQGRSAPLEQNPSSAGNLWFVTYREQSPLQAEDWEKFRDPDAMTYRAYVNAQAESEAKIHGVLEEYADLGADAKLDPAWIETLGTLLTPSRYYVHGCQQVEAYIGYMAPTSYITNAAGLSTADFLRRVTTIAYRTRTLQLAHPDAGIGTSRERSLWQKHEGWQPVRRAIESVLATYDWGEAFTALNLVILPTLDDVLTRQLGEVAVANGDNLTWLVQRFLAADEQRRGRWSRALADFAAQQRPASGAAVHQWIRRWTPFADEAAAGLGSILATVPTQRRSVDDIVAGASAAREAFLDGLASSGDTTVAV